MTKLIELVSLEFVFSQQRLLHPDEFRRECTRRGLSLFGDEQLEELHKSGLLIPIYRVSKNARGRLTEARRRNTPPYLAFGKVSTSGSSLRAYQGDGNLCDPRDEPFRPWSRYHYRIDNYLVDTSEFLYSPYQLLLLPTLRNFVPRMRMIRTPAGQYRSRLKLTDRERRQVQIDQTYNDELVIALTTLERVYLPRIIGTIRLPENTEFEAWKQFENTFDPVTTLSWLGWKCEQVQETAERLLSRAEGLDPLADWLELVRLCRPEKWERLRGDARVAIDHRIAAELLLRFYEDLVEVEAAPPLPSIPRFARHPLQERLQPNYEELDPILMDFGISPHPSLVLLLEGETEMLIIPKVMEMLGIPQRRSFIEIHNYRGISARIDQYASYIAPLSLGAAEADYVEFTRPPTRFLVVADPEQKFADPDEREQMRQQWIEYLFRALPKEHQTQTLRSGLEWLVEIETWGAESFEFAHFENDEIVQAINNACEQVGVPLNQISISQVQQVRQLKKSVDKVWSGSIYGPRLPLSKPILAEALWPILEQKIRGARKQDALDSIPVVRVLHRAVNLALQVHRDNVVIQRS